MLIIDSCRSVYPHALNIACKLQRSLLGVILGVRRDMIDFARGSVARFIGVSRYF